MNEKAIKIPIDADAFYIAADENDYMQQLKIKMQDGVLLHIICNRSHIQS